MLQLTKVRKAYKTAGFEQVALDDLSVAFRDNEFVAILGPSGSGKTTLLNIVGGLDHYDSGDLIIDGISTTCYKDRDWDRYRNNRIGFVFQSYNLIPHQSVLVNVELALTLAGVSRAQRRERALRALEEVGLGEHVNKRPNQLSGGQMQRVAIARALINDPEIVLADEPTGALDSKTSVQIMALLTKIAENRLVVMVTHNPDLAARYANRTVRLSDGRIEADSNPFIPTVADVEGKGRPARKTAMGFFTALALSFTNLMTKKGRTVMTAFAGSIGIIGIAAILALANGVNSYIKATEESLLTVYPLGIQSSGLDLTAMLSASVSTGAGGPAGLGAGGEGDAQEGVVITERKSLTGTFSSIGQNDLAALKAYLDADGGGVRQYVNAIEYSYGVTPQVFSLNASGDPIQVNPDALSRGMGLDQGGGFGTLMTFGTSTSLFNPLIEDTALLEDQYEVVAGRWPGGYDECIVVLDSGGTVSDYLLYLMGLRDPSEFETMVEQFRDEKEVAVPEDTLDFVPSDLLGVSFRVVPATEFYTYDEAYAVWTDRTGDKEYMKGLVEAGETLSVVGIVQADPDATATSLGSGIYYPASLTHHLMEQAAQSKIVADQLANKDVNVFTGKTFEEERESAAFDGFEMGDLMTVDEAAITGAFSVDTSALNVDLSGVIDPARVAESLPATPEVDVAKLAESLDIDVPTEELTEIASEVMEQYLRYALKHGMTTPDAILDGLPAYLSSSRVQARLITKIDDTVDVEGIQAELEEAVNQYMRQTLEGYLLSVMAVLQQQIEVGMGSAMQQFAANMAGAMRVDQDAFMNAFQFNLDEEELSQIVMTMMSGESNTYDNNLKKLGYADAARPSGIDIYPLDFESKQSVIGVLDDYNTHMREDAQEDKVIAYTDFVGLIMTSVTEIINMISYVLVAFVAISLVVSSIMIGVITYISVLERKKEIGILRAIGARKRDIGNVFNAETLIVGLIAGLMGILITVLLIIPTNLVVASSFGIEAIAILPVPAAVVLVVVSMALTFIAGLIPASAAARRDPVEALRSE
ncbi:MAG: ABC transporter ATP-binding protein/permease [Coriobacteriales bacterium]|jgi:ABC-type lipoprotein export system ATPase subunit|nr:ABC transporter ATP-binding protein/permease [Coriobacteriales bacterium]